MFLAPAYEIIKYLVTTENDHLQNIELYATPKAFKKIIFLKKLAFSAIKGYITKGKKIVSIKRLKYCALLLLLLELFS